jgi:uncharacterized lipoprotein YddW (UPF0748 family)
VTKRLVMVILAAIVLAASSCCIADEIRGAWLSGWGHGYLTAAEVDATIVAAKKAGINALFIQVRKNADSYYDSKLEPRATNIAADFDPLAYTIEKAHAQGIQVHAWVNAYRVWSSAPVPSDPKHIVNAHPDWINKDVNGSTKASEGVYLDPGVPAAREHLAKVVMDIATKYNVDGIQWDYIRYPGRTWGYSDAALARYYAETNTTAKPDPKDPKWSQWRRDQVTALVRLVDQQVGAIKPKLVISASTIAWGNCSTDFANTDNYVAVFQDWKSWVADGILDANLPMVYKSENLPESAKSFRGWLAGFVRWGGGKPTYVGIEARSSDSAGVVAQIEAIHKAGLQGFVLFAFNQSQRRDSLVEALAAAGKPAVPATDSPKQ